LIYKFTGPSALLGMGRQAKSYSNQPDTAGRTLRYLIEKSRVVIPMAGGGRTLTVNLFQRAGQAAS
jgi:hypothetical protein